MRNGLIEFMVLGIVGTFFGVISRSGKNKQTKFNHLQKSLYELQHQQEHWLLTFQARKSPNKYVT